VKIQTTRTVDDTMDEDWRSRFLPGEEEVVDDGPLPIDEPSSDGLPESFETTIGTDAEEIDIVDEKTVANLLEEGPESQLAVVLDNQQRLMMAIDQMASGFSNQLVILARRIDNFERVLDQSVGQPTMTNLMFDAPEVFDKIVNREEEEVQEDDQEDDQDFQRASEPRVPVEGFEIPDEIEHLLNYSADFPVSVEVQSAYHMWKQKHSSFQEFVKAAGGPVAAKTARSHLE